MGIRAAAPAIETQPPRRRVSLPVVGQQGKIRPSKNSRRRAAVLIGIHLLILFHVIQWRLTGRTLKPIELAEAMEIGKQDLVNAGLIFFAAAILATAVLGRFFCGWGCHLVALQDLCRWLLGKVGIRPRPLRSRLLGLVPVVAFCYMFLWPAFWRVVAGSGLGPLRFSFSTTEFWSPFPGWVVGTLTLSVCGFATVYLLGAKGFCTYACPYGAIFGAVDKLAPARIRVTDACTECGHCTAVCTSNVRVHEEVRDFGMVVDSGCMKCLDCVSVCPEDALYWGFGRPSLLARPRVSQPACHSPAWGWSEELFLLATFLLVFLAIRGLYGLFPFLFALGLAAILAYLALEAVQLLTLPDLALRRVQLKRGGRLRLAGRSFLAAGGVLAILWGHSAWIQTERLLGDRLYRQTEGLRSGVLRGEGSLRLSARQSGIVEGASRHLGRAAAAGLLPQPDLAIRRAWLAFLLGDRETFRAEAQVASAYPPDAALAEYLLGREAAARGAADEAERAFRRSLTADSGKLDTYLALGNLLALGGQPAAAAQVFEEGLRRVPGRPELYSAAGLAHTLAGDTALAIERLGQARAIAPADLTVGENLVGLLEAAQRRQEAAAELERLLALAPERADLRVKLAHQWLALGDRPAAAEEARQARELDPQAHGLAAIEEELAPSGGEAGTATAVPIS